MVSHDRFFLDRTADVVYELSEGRLTRYPGNYTHYREEKLKKIQLQKKAYERQLEELERLGGLVERFKHKPNKASLPVQNARPWSGWNGWKGPRRMTATSLQER